MMITILELQYLYQAIDAVTASDRTSREHMKHLAVMLNREFWAPRFADPKIDRTTWATETIDLSIDRDRLLFIDSLLKKIPTKGWEASATVASLHGKIDEQIASATS